MKRQLVSVQRTLMAGVAIACLWLLCLAASGTFSSTSAEAGIYITPTATPTPRPGWMARSQPTLSAVAKKTPTPTATPTPRYLPPAPQPDGEPARFIISGDPARCAALTFDMAPYGDEASTAAVFDALRDNKVRSTFFLTGEWAERNPEFVKRIVNEGHELANHSFDHPHFTRISEYEMLSQIARTDGLMESITGVVPSPYFRPPFGDYDGRVLRALGGPGYYVIYWSLDSSDWQPDSTAESVASRVIRLTEMGDIVVMHGYIPKTAEAMPVIIAGLRERGICLDTLTALLR